MPAQIFAPTPAVYDDAFTIQGQLLKQVAFAVSSPNSALFQIAKLGTAGVVEFDLQDLTAQPGQQSYTNIFGIRFKSADPANPTVVLCQAFFADDAIPLGAIASGASFGTTGPVNPGIGAAITGRVSAAGAQVAGSGFTVAHIATGHYQITFTAPFAAIPVVLVTGEGTTFTSDSWTVEPALGTVDVFCQVGGIGPTDQPFAFTAQAPV